MRAFADLPDALIHTRSRNAELRLTDGPLSAESSRSRLGSGEVWLRASGITNGESRRRIWLHRRLERHVGTQGLSGSSSFVDT